MEEKGDRENKVHDYQMEGDIKEKPFNELEPRGDQGPEQEVGTSPVPMDMDQRTKDTKAEENDSSDLDWKNISESTTTSLETPASETRTLKSSNSLNISQSGVRPKSFKTKLHRKTPASETRTLKSSNSLNISQSGVRPKSFKTKLHRKIFNVQSVKKELLKKVKKNRKEEKKRKEELIDLEMESEIKKMKREREDAKARTKQLKKQAQLSDVQREGKELIDKLVENRQLEKKKQNEEIELANEAVIEKGEREQEDANASQIRQNKEAQKNEEIIIEECTATIELNEKDTKVLERLSVARKHYRQMTKALEDVTWLCLLDGFSNDQSRVNASRIMKKTKKGKSTLEIVDGILTKFGQNKIETDSKKRNPSMSNTHYPSTYLKFVTDFSTKRKISSRTDSHLSLNEAIMNEAKDSQKAKEHQCYIQNSEAVDAGEKSKDRGRNTEEENKAGAEKFEEELRKRDDLCVIDTKNQTQESDLITQRMGEQMKIHATVEGSDGRSTDAFVAERNELRTQQSTKWKEGMDNQRRKEIVLSKASAIPVEDDEHLHNKMDLHEDGSTKLRIMKYDQAIEAEMNEHRIKCKERVDHQRQKDTVLRKDKEKPEEYDEQCHNIIGQHEEDNTRIRMIKGDQAIEAEMNEHRIKCKERVDHQIQKDTVLTKDKEKPEEYDEQCHNIIGQHEEDNTRIRMIKGDQAPPLFVVAIDFGTTYSGWAYSSRNDFLKDPSIVYGYHWNNGGNIMMKTNTCILFDKEGSQTGKYDSCGYDAYDKYVNLCADKKQHDYYFFSCYKMILYENMDISSQSMIKTVDGKEMRAVTVFSETIRYFVEHFNSENAKLYEYVRPDEIRWVLTVPAIWNEKAKTFMREAAIAAGLESARLNIALEPEAAALYCKSLSFQTDNSIFSVFKPNTKYMVLDVGGGTYDITVNKVTPEGLEEVHMANGRNNGGTTIKKAFWDLLTIVYGKDTIADFRTNNHDDELRFEQDFEIRKTFIALNDKREHMYLPIPAALHNIFIKSKTMTEIDQQWWKSIFGEEVEIDLKRGKLKISIKLLENLFKDSFIQIYKRISELLAKPELSDLTAILMVGGFSDSPLLYGILKEHLKIDHKKVHILKPKEAASAVMKGAVYFGHLL